MTDANAWLMSGGTPWVKFPVLGSGIDNALIVSPPEVQQQTDFNSGVAKTYDNGDPMEEFVIRVQTEERDPEIPFDDGIRALHVRGQNLGRLRLAVRTAGATGVAQGGRITARYTEDGERKGNNNPPKLHSYVYTAPSTAAANDFLNNAGAAQNAAPVQQQLAAQSPPNVAGMPAAMQQALLAAQQGVAAQQQPPVQQPPAQPVQQPIPQPVAAQPAQNAAPQFTEQQLTLMRAIGVDPATMMAAQQGNA